MKSFPNILNYQNLDGFFDFKHFSKNKSFYLQLFFTFLSYFCLSNSISMYKLLFISLGFILFSCSSMKVKDGLYNGKYYSILLKNSNYIIYDNINSKNSICCDTLSWGNFRKINKNNFLEFKSDENFNKEFIYSEVTEEKIDSNNILYFKIINPIENDYIKYNDNNREIYYKIVLFSNRSFFDTKILSQKFYNNTIAIDIPEGLKVDSFYIEVYINNDALISNRIINKFSTLDYSLKDEKSNSFLINIDNLDYNYFNFLRLDKDYIKVEKDKLIWNNQEFKLKK